MTTTLGVQATPGGQLAAEVRQALGSSRGPDGGTTQVLERPGRSVAAGLRRADPLWSKECPYPDKCWVKEGVSCWKARVVYRLVCGCGAKYYGTTGHTMHNRCISHQEALTKGDTSYAITRHRNEHHQDWDPDQGPLFGMELVDQRASNLERYIAEGCAIEQGRISSTKEESGEEPSSQDWPWQATWMGEPGK